MDPTTFGRGRSSLQLRQGTLDQAFRRNTVASTREAEMATRKRSDSKTPKPLPPRSCVVCTESESDVQLIRPCRSCTTDYCTDCLVGMFQSAITDSTRMPPRCCNLLQVHTILGKLTYEESKAYREKFEEWITPVKAYCPSPTCSAFIPERKLPATAPASSIAEMPTIRSVLTGIVNSITKSGPARFFRGHLDISILPGYTKVVLKPMDLKLITNKLNFWGYKTTAELTEDMRLIVTNAKEYNGENHPVAKAADELFACYLEEVSKSTDRLIKSSPQSLETIFACPKCHIAICVSCKEIEHTGAPCDTSAQDHELAMLHTFGYKRCPRCKAGVKKMYGCSHMQCICGAHWCYYCQQSIELCDGTCEARALEDESEEDYDSEEDESELEDGEVRDPPAPATAQAPVPLPRPSFPISSPVRIPALPSAPPPAPRAVQQNENAPVNLDAGGGRRWAEGEYDFGEEPEDEGFAQVWSCAHKFETYSSPPDDGINRGNLDKMECNRCFTAVQPKISEPKTSTKKRRKVVQSQGSKNDPILIKDDSPSPVSEMKLGWECSRCKLVVCPGCKAKYKSVQEDD